MKNCKIPKQKKFLSITKKFLSELDKLGTGLTLVKVSFHLVEDDPSKSPQESLRITTEIDTPLDNYVTFNISQLDHSPA